MSGSVEPRRDSSRRIPVETPSQSPQTHQSVGEIGPDPRRRLFLGLLSGTAALVCVFLAALFVVPYVGLSALPGAVTWILGVAVALLVLLVAWATLGLILHVWLGRPMLFTGSGGRIRGLTVKLFLPLMTLLGRLLGVPKDRVRSSFIKVNNDLVLSEHATYPPEKVLMLTPHCLQRSDCPIRLTHDVGRCKRCGKCPIDGLLALSDRYGVGLAVATGGTIARRIVVERRPRLILAVACERDLAEGIQDTYPLRVFGVLNSRPQGPCLDTLVAHAAVEAAIRHFVRPLPSQTASHSPHSDER